MKLIIIVIIIIYVSCVLYIKLEQNLYCDMLRKIIKRIKNK